MPLLWNKENRNRRYDHADDVHQYAARQADPQNGDDRFLALLGGHRELHLASALGGEILGLDGHDLKINGTADPAYATLYCWIAAGAKNN